MPSRSGGHARIGDNRQGSHIFIVCLAKANAGIKLLGDNISKAVMHIQLAFNIRPAAQQLIRIVPLISAAAILLTKTALAR